MSRRPTHNINTVPAPYTTTPFSNYTNCTIAQTQSGNIDQSRHEYETYLATKILNSKTLTASEKVKFLKLLGGW